MSLDLVRERVQRHLARSFAAPEDVVAWYGAVQAQDYLGSLWALGLRTRNATEAGVERAIAEKRIVRSWPLRGTLHFVAPADLRWMLELAAPATMARARKRHHDLGIDDATLARSRKIVERALRDGQVLTRPEMYEALARGGVSPEGQRGIHVLLRLSQERLLCFGPRRGKQPTFTLLEEWLPPTKKKTREEALAELARRYFTSHGPATTRDFAWWSGLVAKDVRDALESVKDELEHADEGGVTYRFVPVRTKKAAEAHAVELLPAFDEYLVAYANRDALIARAPSLGAKTINAGGGMLAPTIVVGGQVVGTWKRTLAKSVTFLPTVHAKLTATDAKEVAAAAERYAQFLGLPLKADATPTKRR